MKQTMTSVLAIAITITALNGGTAGLSVARASEPDALQAVRFLRVTNATGERLKVYVRFCVSKNGENDVWMQTDDRTGVLAYSFEPGESATLAGKDGELAASKARIWAVSATGKTWTTYKERDLLLVEEPYRGNAVRTHTLTFGGKSI